jgi:RNA polymerase sigma-70 factor, ECF subfamily
MINFSTMAPECYNNETDLIKACIRHDPGAWAAFTERYSRLMKIAIKKQLGRCGLAFAAHDIEDILQDTLTSIWRDKKLASVGNMASLTYWLAIVSQNAALSHLRKIRNEGIKETLPSVDTEDAGCDLSSILPASGPDPIDELSYAELSGKLDDAIGRLPPNEKLVIKLHILHGKGYHEIARMLGMPKGTVSSSIKRGKEKLQDVLKDFFAFFGLVYLLAQTSAQNSYINIFVNFATISPFLASYIVGGQK